MRAPIGLQVEPYDFDDTNFLNVWWEQVNFGAYQVGYGECLFPWQRIHPNGIICLHRLVNFFFDIAYALFIQVFHGEVHPCPVGIHLAPCDLYAEFFPDGATEYM